MNQKMLSFEEIEALIAAASLKIFGNSLSREAYHGVDLGQGWLIEINEKYHSVDYDRNCEVGRKSFETAEDLVFYICRSWAFAAGYSKAQRENIAGRDLRRTAFAHEAELMGRYSVEWQKRTEQRQTDILENNPYNDEAYL